MTRSSRARIYPTNSRGNITIPTSHISLNSLSNNVTREVLRYMSQRNLDATRGTSTSMRNFTSNEKNERNREFRRSAASVVKKVLESSFNRASDENKTLITNHITNTIKRQLNKTRNTKNMNAHNVSNAFQALRGRPWNLTPQQIVRGDVISMQSRGINDNDMKSFSIACEYGALTQCTNINLGNNQIGDVGIQVFSKALAVGALAQLTQLELDRNQIGDVGMQAFSTALASGALASCQKLNLIGNQIGDKGMEAFSKALAKRALPSCKWLYLFNNQIGNAGMKALCIEIINGALPQLSNLIVAGNPAVTRESIYLLKNWDVIDIMYRKVVNVEKNDFSSYRNRIRVLTGLRREFDSIYGDVLKFEKNDLSSFRNRLKVLICLRMEFS